MIASRTSTDQYYTADKFRMLSKFGPESGGIMGGCPSFLHTPMIDCCNAQLQIPKRDILLSLEHKRDR